MDGCSDSHVRTDGVEPATSAVAGQRRSQGRRSLRQELNPHLGRTKGACLPLTLRRLDGDGGSRTRSSSLQARCSATRASSPRWSTCVMRTDGVEPPQREAPRLQRGELTLAQRPPNRKSKVADRVRTGADGAHNPGCFRYTTATTKAGTTGLEPAASRLTSECSAHLSYAPEVRGWDSNPRSRAHEAREDSRSSTAQVWPAGVEPAISGARSRRGDQLPHSQKTIVEHPRRDSNPQLPG